MHRFRNILVGVDLSHADRLAASELNPPTLEAIRRALWLAARLSSHVTFFSAIDLSAKALEMLQDESAESPQTVEDAANTVLAELVERARGEGVDADSQLIFGTPWVEVIRRVLRENHDLVIVGTRDLGATKRMLFGSTGIKLVRNCPCPVWITRPDSNWDDLNILVASDLSEVARDALDVAVGGAQLSGARLSLLHALDLPTGKQSWQTGLPQDKFDDYRAKAQKEAEQQLHEQLALTDYRTLAQGVQVHVKQGPADVVVLDAIEQWNIDLLVMGTVARSGIPGLLVGNTAERLLPEISCSLLAVKPDGFQCPITLE